MTAPRIVIMANSIEELGGAQRVVHVLAQGLAERGYPVDLVGITPATPQHTYLDVPLFDPVTLMSREWPAPARSDRFLDRWRPSVRRVRATRDALRQEAIANLGRLLADGPPGIVITSQLWAMEHLAEVPHDGWAVIGQYHSSFEAAAAGRDLERAVRLYRDVDRFLLLTPADAERFRRQGLDNTGWLPNPLAFWPDVPAAADDARTILYLGRLSPEKGPTFLVDAWGMVADRHPDWRLRIVGSGPDEALVRRAIAALPAGGDRVALVAPVSDAEAELRSASLFALPSLTEGLPLSLAEAMAHGLPCVAADCSTGVGMLADGGAAALLVPRADPVALAGELDALMADAGLRADLGARARAAVEPYRSGVVLDAWESVIAAVLR